MRIKRTITPRTRVVRHRRVIAIGAGLTAAAALMTPVASAQAPSPTTFSAAQLKSTSDAVLKADVGGTSWYTDKANGKVVVTADSTVSKAEIAKIKDAAGARAGAIEVKRTPGKLQKFISGGDAIYASAGWRCSLGFNVRSGSTYYFLTAGHCTEGYPSWTTSSGASLGPTAGTSFPGNDYGIVQYTGSVSHEGTVGSQDITGAANPSVNQSVTRRGSTTGIHSGRVTALNATVDYGGGDVVSGLIQTTVCAEPGDSGGPLYAGSTALGLTSGGSGNCSSGGTTYFQPVVEALNAYGVSVY